MAGWESDLHPRIPGHHHGGGEFTKKGAGAKPSDPGQTVSRFAHPSTGAAMGKTEIGDTYEELFRSHGAHLIEKHFGHPYVEISGAGSRAGGKSTVSRTTPLDFRLDHRYGGELKTLNIHAKNQRIAMKTEEVERKKNEVAKNGWMPLIVIQVVDQQTGTVHVYVNEGFSSKKVTTMKHVGSYTYTQKDFRQAQQRKGHWEKRHTRAVAV